eukprot:TRINITY_DN54064_c0_g1_i1.p1 TRINITY_DN54064_c0_g1~~TRINITY_DN54064_c0_g1_i1.p1  ORF type:complete len:733 (-),score=174.19 TRINITY_DN54064_c0_g1_i1:226-2424(-)
MVDAIGVRNSKMWPGGEEPETEAEAKAEALEVAPGAATDEVAEDLARLAMWDREWEQLAARAEEQQAALLQSQWALVRQQLSALSHDLVASKQASSRDASNRRCSEERQSQRLSELSETFREELGCMRRGLDDEVSRRCLADEQLERRTEELRAALIEDGERTRTALNAEARERSAGDETAARRLDRAVRQFEAAETRRRGLLTASSASPPVAEVVASNGGGIEAHVEAALGDTRQCLESEAHARRQLEEAVECLRVQLGEERQLRETSDSRVQVRLGSLEENSVPGGVAALESRLSEFLRRVPEEVGCASDVAMEAHLTRFAAFAASVREELRLQEERLQESTSKLLQGRLGEFAASLHDEMCRLEAKIREDVAKHLETARPPAFKAAFQEALTEELARKHADRGGVGAVSQSAERLDELARNLHHHTEVLIPDVQEAVGSLSVRMNELAGMLREELRRQDCLEGRIQDLAGAFHDEIRRQEEVVLPDSLAGLEGRFDHFATSLREETVILRGSLASLEAQLGDQSVSQRQAFGELEEKLDTRVKALLAAETEERGAEIGAVRDLADELLVAVRAWDEKEKDLWHALDTHTHDVAVDTPPASASLQNSEAVALRWSTGGLTPGSGLIAPPGNGLLTPGRSLTPGRLSSSSGATMCSATSAPLQTPPGHAPVLAGAVRAAPRAAGSATHHGVLVQPPGVYPPQLTQRPGLVGAAAATRGSSAGPSSRVHRAG